MARKIKQFTVRDIATMADGSVVLRNGNGDALVIRRHESYSGAGIIQDVGLDSHGGPADLHTMQVSDINPNGFISF